MAEGVRCGGLRDACLFYGTFEGALKGLVIHVMATHDTELLAMKEVKKDEVWFTRLSGPERSTELYALSEFDHLDESRDYRKEYLGGFYGALPSTGRIFGEDE